MGTRAFVVVLAALLASAGAAAQTAILGGGKERQPGYGEIENFTVVGYSDLDGWDKPTEIRVSADGKLAFTAHNPPPTATQKMGGSIIDVSDPARPRVLARVSGPPTVHSQYLDVLGNLLALNQERLRGVEPPPQSWEPGLRLFDISDPARPREVGFFRSDDPPGVGVHGFWLHEDPKLGKLAYLATSKQGYLGNILLIVDINDPSNPREIARWWYPGQWTAGGEKPGPNWIGEGGLTRGLPNIWVYLHDMTVYKDRAYLAYRDQGLVILDVSDPRKPTMIGQIKWTPPDEGNAHSVGIVVPPHGGRPDVVVVTDEINRRCPWGYLRIIDVRYEPNPIQIATFRLPLNRFCPPDRPGEAFGIHDVDRLIRGPIVFSAWEYSGFWAIDIADPYRPRAVGHFVPPPFVRAGLNASQADDVFVHDNGLVYGTSSEPGGGLWVLRYTPGVKGIVAWNPDGRSVTFRPAPVAEGPGALPPAVSGGR
ncbi:MAG TPA: hypothetical protein VNM66_02705 [Thermodesulfobacteriota bacterium]|nr:hypothetical protein [Thermodesulfobacteriota bacterium]